MTTLYELHDPRLEAIARGIHKFDCLCGDEDRRRHGLPPVDRWADPWHPGGARQLAKLRREAAVILSELDALKEIAP